MLEPEKSQAKDGAELSSASIAGPVPARSKDGVSPELELARGPDGAISISIHTERLELSSVEREEAVMYHEHLFGDADVMRKFATGETRDAQYVGKRIEVWAKRNESGDPFSALTIRAKDGSFIGMIVMGHGETPGHAELAYIIRKEEWAKGYGSEAAAAVVGTLAPRLAAEGFNAEGAPFRFIDATARPDNPASVRIVEKAGMKVVGESEKFGAHRLHFSIEIPERGSLS